MARSQKPSEFGGVPGRIQPTPHTPTNAENISLIYAVDPTNPEGAVPESKKRR